MRSFMENNAPDMLNFPEKNNQKCEAIGNSLNSNYQTKQNNCTNNIRLSNNGQTNPLSTYNKIDELKMFAFQL